MKIFQKIMSKLFNKIRDSKVKFNQDKSIIDEFDSKIGNYNNISQNKNNQILKKNIEIDNKFDDIKKKDFNFIFCDFVNSFICKEKKNKVYQIATQNLENYMDINSFLFLKHEVTLLKELFLIKVNYWYLMPFLK